VEREGSRVFENDEGEIIDEERDKLRPVSGSRLVFVTRVLEENTS